MRSGPRVLVCGGRDFRDWKIVQSVLHTMTPRPSAIIQGGADGADRYAADWARRWDRDLLTFQADWGTYGKAAGPIRNQRMIDEGKPDLVVAFPGGRGTADMVRRAKVAGITVREVQAES